MLYLCVRHLFTTHSLTRVNMRWKNLLLASCLLHSLTEHCVQWQALMQTYCCHGELRKQLESCDFKVHLQLPWACLDLIGVINNDEWGKIKVKSSLYNFLIMPGLTALLLLPSHGALWGFPPQCFGTWCPWWLRPSPPAGAAEWVQRPRPGWRQSSGSAGGDWPRCEGRTKKKGNHI